MKKKENANQSRFFWRMPQNAASFFDLSSDRAFRRNHPYAYGFLVFAAILSLLGPVLVWIIYTGVLRPAPNSGWLMLGWLGAFIFGIGLFNFVAAILKQYLGHWLSISCFALGALLVAISVRILY
ncbi:hypothetical protein SDC9_80523 [bioreactor metagenome]|uniref:Uncharacterized protein n=1 Tax=bioreactor metagenome TaxID=1076179 RepID=A0A644YZP4_9ZZZZ|nr:hypothetical protein [Christensenella sp.]